MDQNSNNIQWRPSVDADTLSSADELIANKHRIGANVNVYLVLRQDDKVLLCLRKNTGYLDGCYGLVSGHVENKESAIAAMIREANEEAGIQIESNFLHLVHVMHRKTNRYNIDLFFESTQWQGVITNREPQKCAALSFFL